jgi:preprotein translocase subunit SecA
MNKFKAVAEDKQVMFKDAHKWIMLETIDQAWKQHMLNLDHLKEGISLRSWGQKNPLIEYKREAFAMFEDMMNQVRMEVVNLIFHLNVEHFNSHELERKRQRELDEISMVGPEDPEGDISVSQAVSQKIGRNEDCPCGSGKKYKKCCGKGT